VYNAAHSLCHSWQKLPWCRLLAAAVKQHGNLHMQQTSLQDLQPLLLLLLLVLAQAKTTPMLKGSQAERSSVLLL
jgi:hypothetical protein